MKAPLRWTASLWSRRAALVALLLLAFALRLYLLEHQSLWADEGNSVAMAPRAPLDIIQRTANDIHPPLYYLLLHYWSALVGTSVFAVRSFSVLCGVVAVLLTYAIARTLRGSARLASVANVAIVAAGLLTISPFAIHYSQETRMYMLVTALGAGSWWAWLCWRKDKIDQIAVVYWLVTLALIYSHYYAVPLVVAQNIAWLIALKDHRTHLTTRLRVWVIVQGTLVLAYLPWLWYARDTILNWPSISEPVTLEFMVREIAQIFTLGLANEGLPLWVGLLVGLLLAAGLLGAARMRYGYVAILYFIIPPALMLLLSVDRPFWNPKFLLISLPGYCLLLGVGVAQLVAWLPRWGKSPIVQAAGTIGGLALFAFATYPALHNEYHNPRYARDDYKGMIRTILAQAGANDAILLDGAGQREIFDYYYTGALAVYGLPATQPLDVTQTETELANIAESHDQLWVLWWAEQEGDPELFIPTWLDENSFEAGSRWFGNVRLARYLLGDPPPLTEINADFLTPDAPITLQLQGIGIEPATIIAGDVLALYSSWQSTFAQTPSSPPFTFFAQLLDSQNRVISQYDGNGGAPPVREWADSQTMPLRMGMAVPVGTPPGDYRLILGAYDSNTGQRLATASGDALEIGSIQVIAPPVPPTVDAINLPNAQFMDTSFGSLALVAAQANKLGSDHAPETPLRAGDPLSVLLYWQLRTAEATLPALTLQLRDSAAQPRAEWQFTPTDNTYPLDQWRVNDLIRDPYTYFLPADFPPGTYDLVVTNGTITQLIEKMVIVDS
jgi:mannosyltransferase